MRERTRRLGTARRLQQQYLIIPRKLLFFSAAVAVLAVLACKLAVPYPIVLVIGGFREFRAAIAGGSTQSERRILLHIAGAPLSRSIVHFVA
jgi:hypothetical protein